MAYSLRLSKRNRIVNQWMGFTWTSQYVYIYTYIWKCIVYCVCVNFGFIHSALSTPDTLCRIVCLCMFVCIVAYGCIADPWMVTVDPKRKIRSRTFHCYFNQENSHRLATLTRCVVFVACKNIIFNISKLNKQMLFFSEINQIFNTQCAKTHLTLDQATIVFFLSLLCSQFLPYKHLSNSCSVKRANIFHSFSIWLEQKALSFRISRRKKKFTFLTKENLKWS